MDDQTGFHGHEKEVVLAEAHMTDLVLGSPVFEVLDETEENNNPVEALDYQEEVLDAMENLKQHKDYKFNQKLKTKNYMKIQDILNPITIGLFYPAVYRGGASQARTLFFELLGSQMTH